MRFYLSNKDFNIEKNILFDIIHSSKDIHKMEVNNIE